MRIMRYTVGLISLSLLAACATPTAPSEPVDGLQPVPEPPDTLEYESPPESDQAVALTVQPLPVMRPTGYAGPGMWPGLTERSAEPLDSGHFERRLQERQKRVHLGLDRPQREHAPVDNIFDFDF